MTHGFRFTMCVSILQSWTLLMSLDFASQQAPVSPCAYVDNGPVVMSLLAGAMRSCDCLHCCNSNYAGWPSHVDVKHSHRAS